MNFIFDQIKDALSRAQNIIIISHRQPDGDACGSALAMAHYLKSQNKRISIFCDGEVPSYFNHLPGIEIINSNKYIFNSNWDLVLFVDCSDLPHSNLSREEIRTVNIINIDHHFSNQKFGTINYIDPQASSTSEIIYSFFESIGYEIDQKIASCILAGILTDTHAFTNAATNDLSISIASDLVKRGANINLAFNQFFKNKSLGALKLWGEILCRLKVNRTYSIAYTYILEEDYAKFAVAKEDMDGLVNFMNIIVDIKACFVIKMEGDMIKISSRTNKEDIDLSSLAQLFGGGGHKKAAGFSLPWPAKIDNGKLIIN